MANRRSLRYTHRVGYALGSASLGFAESSIAIFYLFYLTNVVGLGAGLAGAIFALPKVWDALVDPIVGTWIDRVAMRIGRRWPFVLTAGLMIYAAYVGMFSLPGHAPHWTMAVVSLGLLIGFSTSRTVFGICQLSISTEITEDEAELSRLYSLALMLYTAASLGGSVLPPLLVTWFGGDRGGYSSMAGVGAAISSVMLVAFTAMTKNVPVRTVTGKASSQSLFASFRSTIRNNAFIFLLAYYVVLCVCTAVVSAFLPYLNLYLLHGGRARLAILTGLFSISGIIGYPLAPLLVRRLGAVRSLKIGNVLMVSMFVALFFASYSALWTTWLVMAVVGICSGVLSVVFLTALVDVSRAPVSGGLVVPLGFYFGVILSGTKLGQSAGGIVVGSLLDVAGFVPNGAHQAEFTLMAIRSGYTLLPAALFGVCNVFLSRLIRESDKTACDSA